MQLPGFTGDCLRGAHAGVVRRSSRPTASTVGAGSAKQSVSPAIPPRDINARACYADCMAECEGGRSECDRKCNDKCTSNSSTVCWDEPDPNYQMCLNAIDAWQVACLFNPLMIGPHGWNLCPKLAKQMKSDCHPTRRVCTVNGLPT